MLTSNRTRDLHDALKRRCLYHWIDYPPWSGPSPIMRRRVPAASTTVAEQVAAAVARLRTLDAAEAAGRGRGHRLGARRRAARPRPARRSGGEQTLGSVLKYREDIDLARERGPGLGGDLLSLDLADVAGSFGQLLHAAGVPVTPERSGRFARAVALARPLTVDELYWAGRVTLLTGFDQRPRSMPSSARCSGVFSTWPTTAATDRRPPPRSGPAGLDPPRPARRRQPAAAPAPRRHGW